jgi:Ca2+-binding RTX toxin-like protein
MTRKPATRLRLEPLETRALMAASISLQDGVLRAYGTDAADIIRLEPTTILRGFEPIQGTLDGRPFTALRPVYVPGTQVTITDAAGVVRQDANGANLQRSFANSAVTEAQVAAYGDNDRVENDTDLPATVWGGDGRDTLSGGSSADELQGGAGGDSLFGNGGGDRLFGQSHDDYLSGGDGNDSLYGSDGQDILSGGAGADLGDGGTGNDSLYGGDGDDELQGGDGHDDLNGQADDDRLFGENDDDSLDGSTGDDTLSGGAGNDVLTDGSGEDLHYGGDGDDSLDGGSDNDELQGGDGNDALRGGSGDDRLFGQGGHDNLYAGSGDDYLSGSSGDDGLFGGSGDDTVWGGTGDDRVLSWKNATGLFGIKYDPDALNDLSGNDAKINLEDGVEKTIPLEGEDEVYETKSWTHDDVERLDAALAVLHRVVGNTTLLKTNWGWEITFARYGGRARGYNSGGHITLTDKQFEPSNGSENYLRAYVLHEVGHNWDDENPFWQEFLDLSDWTSSDPNDDDFEKAEHYNWWYRKSADFAKGYAKNSPYDDFAESFAAYFMDQAGWVGGYFSASGGAAAIPDKIELIDNWVISL